MATWARGINTDPSLGWTRDSDMVLGRSQGQAITMATGGYTGCPDWHGPHDSMTLGHQGGPRWWSRSHAFVWPPSDNRNGRHQHRTSRLFQGPRSRRGPWSLPRPRHLSGLVWLAGHSHQPVPYHPHLYRSVSLPNLQTIPLLPLFHLLTLCSLNMIKSNHPAPEIFVGSLG